MLLPTSIIFPNSPDPLQGLENELLAWCHWVNRNSPRVIPKMRTMNMESGSLAGPPDPQTLLAVLVHPQLTALCCYEYRGSLSWTAKCLCSKFTWL